MIISRIILPRITYITPLFTNTTLPKLHFPHRRTNLPSFCTSLKNAALSKGNDETGKSLPRAPLDNVALPGSLQRELMPQHVAFILDGNKRWADSRGLASNSGHDAGLKALLEIMELCAKWDIKVATFFLFSSENWSRPKEEIEFVMRRFEKMLVDGLENINRQGIRISTIGDISKLPNSLQEVVEHTKEATKDNTKTHVIYAISYSGKNDLLQACQSIATKVRNGQVEPEDITVTLIEQELETKITVTPCPDLLIRTSGEVRISNFLLWQLAYSEMYFTNTLWPDFHQAEFIEALKSFQSRGRRFGGR